MLTIAYMTNREQPMIEWFFRSLNRELLGNYADVNIVVIDAFAKDQARRDRFSALCPVPFRHVTPKPTPWQGEHRLTDHDAFAASNARNTALCCAQDGYIVFVDDLSVLLHGWLNTVREHMAAGHIVCGAFRKVRELTVDDVANLTHWVRSAAGEDSRFDHKRSVPVEHDGAWFFGCSFAMPVETMLQVNGFDECLDGLSFEDVCFGLRIKKAGFSMWYDQRMLTYESEELHVGGVRRHNRECPPHKDCAWEMLDWIKNNPPQSRGTPDLRKIRENVLAGEEFPMHTGFFIWPDGKNLLGQ